MALSATPDEQESSEFEHQASKRGELSGLALQGHIEEEIKAKAANVSPSKFSAPTMDNEISILPQKSPASLADRIAEISMT